MGRAIARPINAAAAAAAAPRTRLMTSTVGAKSASIRSMMTVGLMTRTSPTTFPSTLRRACTVTFFELSAFTSGAAGKTRVPCSSMSSNLRSAPRRNSCSSLVATGVRSPDDRARSAANMPVSAVASSSAACVANRTARASTRSTTRTPSPRENAPTMSASAKKTCIRTLIP